MENGDIPDDNIKASNVDSYNGETFHAFKARLNSETFAWIIKGSIGSMPWIQADIGYQTCVTGVITQGDGRTENNPDWITKLKVSTFISTTDDSAEVFIEENGAPKVSIDVEIFTCLAPTAGDGILIASFHGLFGVILTGWFN